MAKPVETSSFTVEQIDRQIETINGQQQFLFDLLQPNGDNFVSVDWKKHPELLKENGKLSSRKAVFSAISAAGRGIEGLFDQQVTFPKPPEVITSEVLQSLDKRGLDFVPNPAFPVDNPDQLQAIVDGGRGSSPLLEVFPESYLREVLKGQIAYPHLSGYYEAVDAPGPTTELSSKLGIRDLHKNSIDEINIAIREREGGVLAEWGIDPNGAYIRASVTAKELLMRAALRGEEEHRVTYTRRWGKTDHIVFDGKDMSTRARSEAGIPPRLAVVFSTRPDKVTYLKAERANL